MRSGSKEVESWVAPTGRRWREADGRAMLRALEASGESMSAFGRRHGLNAQRVCWWKVRIAEQDRHRDGMPGFAAVKLIDDRSGTGDADGVEVVMGAHTVRVHRGFCTETLRRVLATLASRAC